jgi:hypothetical protein
LQPLLIGEVFVDQRAGGIVKWDLQGR